MSQFFTVPEIYDDMSKFCQDCGTKFPLPDLFCPNCSMPLRPGRALLSGVRRETANGDVDH